MSDETLIIRVPKRWTRIAVAVAVAAAVVVPTTALASHSFEDVTDANTFHADIEWLKDTGVTRGCNPPDNTRFCPDDAVTRGQMSAFMHRLSTNQVVDAGTLQGRAASGFWQVGGNTGTTPGTDLLGTSDDQPFELGVNNERGLRLEPAVAPDSGEIRPNVVGGSDLNEVADGVVGATISGGGGNGADLGFSELSRPNQVSTDFGTVGGGWGNTASGPFGFSTVAGGSRNTASSLAATVSGGGDNTASENNATVGGGSGNIASGGWATVSGGHDNVASGFYSAVPGGSSNTAGSVFSLAAGRQAKIDSSHFGTFLWADNNTVDFNSVRAREFAARATGGVRMVTAVNTTTGAPTAGAKLDPGSSAWATISSRASKENFTRVDGQEVLSALAEIPIETWNWKTQSPSIRHIGPMAEDFHRAFKLGEDRGRISTVDADGIAFAAIQGLHHKLQAQQAEIDALRTRSPEDGGFPGWALVTAAMAASLALVVSSALVAYTLGRRKAIAEMH